MDKSVAIEKYSEPSGYDLVLREQIKGLWRSIKEREARYLDRFSAMDAKTSIALTSSEKAIAKAEVATEKRFDAVNEFRGTLSDQASTLMPRAEAAAKFKSYDEKIEDLKKEIGGLRESRSGGQAKETAWHFGVGTILSILALVIAMAAVIMRGFGK